MCVFHLPFEFIKAGEKSYFNIFPVPECDAGEWRRRRKCFDLRLSASFPHLWAQGGHGGCLIRVKMVSWSFMPDMMVKWWWGRWWWSSGWSSPRCCLQRPPLPAREVGGLAFGSLSYISASAPALSGFLFVEDVLSNDLSCDDFPLIL